ncbi:integrase/recombinase xerD homolog [Diadema setosum]|uniref:integrase/recombinase xerD homolog n=1 Tax=Diadema setosum TaxID=31175 RepID=UPI003B3A3006
MAEHLVGARSDNTTRKYFSAFQKWEAFISSEGGNAIPAEPIHVAVYITSLLKEGASLSVIQSAIYAVKWAHGVRGLPDPTDNAFVKNLLESAKRRPYKSVKRRDIISSDEIIQLCEKYDGSEDLLVLRDLAYIVISFAGFLRFNEMQSLRASDICFYDDHMSLQLNKSKTDQYRKGSTVVLSRGESSACPLRVLKNYMEKAGINVGSDQFIFRPAFCTKGARSLVKMNKKLSYTRARETVVARLKEVSCKPNLGLHSLRAGGASAAAKSALPDTRLWKRHGRWRSEKAKDGYVEESLEHLLSVSKALRL